jgi:hypothetical protein
MKQWGYWIIIGAGLLALVALIGWASAYTPLLISRASEEWSRGRLLGVTPVSNAVDVQAAPGGGLFLAWADLDDRLHVVQLGTQGQVVIDRTPRLGTDVPREPHFLVGPEGEIHLVWRETGGGRSLLTYARLDSAGSVQIGPLPLSLPGDEAQSPCLAFNSRGGIEVFWTGQAGIYRATLSAEGKMQGEPVLLVDDSRDVSIQVDREGLFHLAWLRETGSNRKAIYYASLDPEQDDLSQPEEMGRLFLRAGQRVESLVMGIDADTGYVLWIIQDLRDIASSARYAFFPLEIPRQKKVRSLWLDEGGNPLSLRAVRGQYETLLVALAETVIAPDSPGLQIGVIAVGGEQLSGDHVWATVDRLSGGSTTAVGQSGWPEDQYVVTASDGSSLKPSLAVDAQGNLHLAWLETGGFGVYRVAYASTAPGVKEAYNALTLWDVTDRALGTAMQLFLVVGFTPVLAFSWSLFPLMLLLGYHLVTGYERLTAPGARAALGGAALLEVVCTYLLYPHRSSMPVVLQWSMPLATAAVALLLTALYLRKRDEQPLFGAFFMFALAHGLLQIMLFVLLRW